MEDRETEREEALVEGGGVEGEESEKQSRGKQRGRRMENEQAHVSNTLQVSFKHYTWILVIMLATSNTLMS